MKKEYDFKKMKEIKNPYPAKKKKAVGLLMNVAMIAFTLNDTAMKAVMQHVPMFQP